MSRHGLPGNADREVKPAEITADNCSGELYLFQSAAAAAAWIYVGSRPYRLSWHHMELI